MSSDRIKKELGWNPSRQRLGEIIESAFAVDAEGELPSGMITFLSSQPRRWKVNNHIASHMAACIISVLASWGFG